MYIICCGTNEKNAKEYGTTQRCEDGVRLAWELFKENPRVEVLSGQNKLIYSIDVGHDALRAKVIDNRLKD